MEAQLPGKDFVRVHRSFLVHLPYIAKFQARRIILKDGTGIPVGVTYTHQMQQAFAEYMERSHIIDFL